MSNRRRALQVLSLMTVGVIGSAGTALGQQVNLGPASDIAWDQPRAIWYFARPGTEDVVGPGFDFVGALLDTGANGVVLGQIAYYDEDFNLRRNLYQVEKRPNGSNVQFEELGVAGTQAFDTLVPYDLLLTMDGETYFTVPNVRGLGNSDILEGGPSAVIGMPAMIGRHVQVNTRSLGELGGLQTSFLSAAPAPTAGSYTVPLTRLIADPYAGQVEENDPLPTYADLPMVQVKTGFADRTSTGISLVDTGAALSMITSQTALELGLNLDPDSATTDIQGSLAVGGIGGEVEAPLVVIDRLVIPTAGGTDLVLTNLVAGVVDIPGIGGIFGMNIFTSGQVPAILGDGQVGYFDTVNFDFTGDDWSMRLDVAPEYHATGGKARELRLAGASGTVPWETTSVLWMDGASRTTYRDNDFVRFEDSAFTRQVNVVQEVRPAWVTFDSSSADRLTGEPIAGSAGLTKRGTGTLTVENSNTYTGRTDVREGKVVFAAPQNIGDVFIQPAGSVEFQASQRLGALRIADGNAIVTSDGAKKLLSVADFYATGTGTLDLTDNDMIVQVPVVILDPLDPAGGVIDPADVYEQVKDLVVQARNADAGRWKGSGLTSSAAAANPVTGLAVLLNADANGNPIYTTFNGEPVDENSILVKYVYNGDANLDGRINSDDYFRIDSGFLSPPDDPTYRDGDFNYDGMINSDDYFLIDSAFLGQGGAMGDAIRAVVVPEPGLGLLLVGAGVLFARRRGR